MEEASTRSTSFQSGSRSYSIDIDSYRERSKRRAWEPTVHDKYTISEIHWSTGCVSSKFFLCCVGAMPPTALHRIHSILKHAVSMREADVDTVCSQVEGILADESLSSAPQLSSCVGEDGWIPIASLLNYSSLGPIVWQFGGVGVVADCLNTRGSHTIELSGDASCLRKRPLRVQLRSEIEYIFSDENYHKDVHLHLLHESDGFVPLHQIISSYSSVHQLLSTGEPLPSVPEALASSAELVVRASSPSPEHIQVRRKTLAEKICSQVEWYLDGERFSSDRFLYETSCDHDGWIPVCTLLSFPRMRKLCHPQAGAVAHVLSSSATVEVSPCLSCVRPRRSVPRSPARASHDARASIFADGRRRCARSWTGPPALDGVRADFSVMTYNLLADMLCTVEQFPTVPVPVLDWEYRAKVIASEVLGSGADVLCMQELQGTAAGAGADDHHSALARLLAEHGYEGRYVRKRKRNGLDWPNAQIGNALFWRIDAFELIEHVEVPIAVTLNACCADEPSAAHFGRGAQVGLCIALRHKVTRRTLVAATTHLSCNFQ